MNEKLLAILKCWHCQEYSLPPIYQCRDGHVVCRKCRRRSISCSECRKEVCCLNRAMGKVARLVDYPCKYEDNGCRHSVRLSGKQNHERNCVFRPKTEDRRTPSTSGQPFMSGPSIGAAIFQVAELVTYACKYASSGCPATFRPGNKKLHEENCNLRPVPCYFMDCKWQGFIHDQLSHYKTSHPYRFLVGPHQGHFLCWTSYGRIKILLYLSSTAQHAPTRRVFRYDSRRQKARTAVDRIRQLLHSNGRGEEILSSNQRRFTSGTHQYTRDLVDTRGSYELLNKQ